MSKAIAARTRAWGFRRPTFAPWSAFPYQAGLRLLLPLSGGFRVDALYFQLYPPQQEAPSVSPVRSAWIGGHGTEP
jgi:hypothetical protein